MYPKPGPSPAQPCLSVCRPNLPPHKGQTRVTPFPRPSAAKRETERKREQRDEWKLYYSRRKYEALYGCAPRETRDSLLSDSQYLYYLPLPPLPLLRALQLQLPCPALPRFTPGADSIEHLPNNALMVSVTRPYYERRDKNIQLVALCPGTRGSGPRALGPGFFASLKQ